MSSVLTSWKEIAQYVGKGVRTVQRWEAQLGFPVRRKSEHAKGSIIAFSEEIDSWLNSTFSSHPDEIKTLLQEVIRLSAENEELRQQLAAIQKTHEKPATQL